LVFAVGGKAQDVSLILKNKAELVEALVAHPLVKEAREAFDSEVEWGEVRREFLREVQRAPGRPKYGEDWQAWLDENVEELLQEALSIVM
jgi:hypothetical protein